MLLDCLVVPRAPCAESLRALCVVSPSCGMLDFLGNSGTQELGNFLGLHLVQRVGLRGRARGICRVSGRCRSWNCETMVVDLCAISASCILHQHPALCANSLPCTLCTICVGLRSQELWNSGTLGLGTFLGLHLMQRVGLRSLARGLCCKADLCSSWNCEIMVVDRRRS